MCFLTKRLAFKLGLNKQLKKKLAQNEWRKMNYEVYPLTELTPFLLASFLANEQGFDG